MDSSDKYSLLEFLLFPPTRLNESRLKTSLRGKTVLITGASFGIGECLAHKLAECDAHLILVARTAEKLEQMKIEIEAKGGKVSVYPTDLTQPESVQALLTELRRLPGGIDIIVSNAGRSIRRPIMESLDRFHDFTRTMAINYFGPVQLLLALIPILKKNQGQIINVSAVNVLLVPAPFWAAYQASKTAFDQWFRCVAPEINALGVRTSSIYLPLVRTRMIAPTAEYKNMPAMAPPHAARKICQSIYTGKKFYAPWWLIFGQLSSVIFRRPWESLMPHFLKKKTAPPNENNQPLEK
ncbi:MAG: SDR family NAD(P)-dependent oxidoreductase [Pyrinomonadaceae bacterium]|nr:SDR family NAD(P)-dependent oxidoreductase [Pyrinomonadaceae bacterium]